MPEDALGIGGELRYQIGDADLHTVGREAAFS
jgi:hypothetical protein